MVNSHLELDCDLAYLLFPHQISGIARGLKHVHDQGIVHGRLCSVRLSLISRFRNPRGLTYPQRNILISPNGTPCITGFGSSFILSRPDLWSDADDVGFHRGTAPELMGPLERGKPATRITKASDMYAFGMLTLEVGIFLHHNLRSQSAYRRSSSHLRSFREKIHFPQISMPPSSAEC